MRLAYIRVSRDKQLTALQDDAMRRENCDRICTDKMSGKRFDRPQFVRMLGIARPVDVIVVWRLDRLGRSLKDLIETINMLSARGAELHSLKENIDTTTPTGRLMFYIIVALVEFERAIISERTKTGLEVTRALGRKESRKPAIEKLRSGQLERA